MPYLFPLFQGLYPTWWVQYRARTSDSKTIGWDSNSWPLDFKASSLPNDLPCSRAHLAGLQILGKDLKCNTTSPKTRWILYRISVHRNQLLIKNAIYNELNTKQGRQWKHSTTLDGTQTHDHWLSRPVLSTGTVAALLDGLKGNESSLITRQIYYQG